MLKDYLTTDDAARELGVSRKTIQSAIYRGRLSAERIGNHTYIIPRAEFDRYRLTPRPRGFPKGRKRSKP